MQVTPVVWASVQMEKCYAVVMEKVRCGYGTGNHPRFSGRWMPTPEGRALTLNGIPQKDHGWLVLAGMVIYVFGLLKWWQMSKFLSNIKLVEPINFCSISSFTQNTISVALVLYFIFWYIALTNVYGTGGARFLKNTWLCNVHLRLHWNTATK